jgi:C4-dicarboxylate transporter DctM subunit
MIIGLSIIAVLVCIFIGVGIPFSFLAGSWVWCMMEGAKMGNFSSTAYYSLDAYSLLALPLFMAAGLLLEKSGIAKQLVDLAEILLRKTKGGMAATVPVVSAFFGALNGSGLATTTTVGQMLGPRLTRKGWDKNYLAALCCLSSPLGYMIPPNMNAIVFTKVSDASVGALFLATLLPGILWCVLYVIINRFTYKPYYDASRIVRDEGEEEIPDEVKDTWLYKIRVIRAAIPAILMPVIILGGIYGGIFTATEAGGIGCVYAFLVGYFVYHGFRKPKDITDIFYTTGYNIGTILMIFPMTLIFSRLLVTHGVPEMVTNFMLGISDNKYVIMFVLDITLIVLGFFLDCNVLLLVITPLLLPTANALDISQIQLATMMFVAVGIGGMTPPMATPLYVAVKVLDADLIGTIKAMLPGFILGAVPMMFLVTYIPQFCEWLPSLLIK